MLGLSRSQIILRLLLLLAVLALLWQYRQEINANQGFALALLTFGLVIVTGIYTWLTYKSLEAMQRIELMAELTGSGMPSILNVANLGATYILTLSGTARIKEIDRTFSFLGMDTLAPGRMIPVEFRELLRKELEQRDLPSRRLHVQGGKGPGHPTHNVYYYDPPTMYTVEITIRYYAVGKRQPDYKIRKGFLFAGTLDDSYAGDVQDVRMRLAKMQ